MKKSELKRGKPMKRTALKPKRKKRRKPKDSADWNVTELKGKADKLWREAIKWKWAWRCVVCGVPANQKQLQAHHQRGCQSLYFRHDLKNGLALCSKCHTFSTELSAHGTPLRFHYWLEENMPLEFAWWESIRHEIHKNPTTDELRETITKLEDYIINKKVEYGLTH